MDVAPGPGGGMGIAVQPCLQPPLKQVPENCFLNRMPINRPKDIALNMAWEGEVFPADAGCATDGAGRGVHTTSRVEKGEIVKIAIACENSRVSEHFGHCSTYSLYSVENGVIFRREELQSPGHQPGALPPFLASHDVTHVIAGGMGPRAVDLFQQHGIQVVLGISGPVDLVAQDFIAGRIIPGVSSCHHTDGHSCDHE